MHASSQWTLDFEGIDSSVGDGEEVEEEGGKEPATQRPALVTSVPCHVHDSKDDFVLSTVIAYQFRVLLLLASARMFCDRGGRFSRI